MKKDEKLRGERLRQEKLEELFLEESKEDRVKKKKHWKKIVKEIEEKHESIERLKDYKVTFISTIENDIKYKHRGSLYTSRCFVIVSNGEFFIEYLIYIDNNFNIYNSSGYDSIGYDKTYKKEEMINYSINTINKYKGIINDDRLPEKIKCIYREFIEKYKEIEKYLKNF